MKTWRFAAFFIFCWSCRPAAVVPENTESAVAEAVNPYLLFGGVSSVSVGIVDEKKTQTFHFGSAFIEKSIPPNDSTLYAIGDLTQVFTATLIADLILEGKIRLSDSLDRHIPFAVPDYNGEKPQIGQLLTHTAGLPFEIEPEYQSLTSLEKALVYKDFAQTDFQTFLQTYPLPYPPGTRYNYSRSGMGVLGYVLTAVTGSSWPDFLAERITSPLGMRDTKPLDQMNSIQFDRLSEAWSSTQKPLTHYQWGEYRGAASLNSSVADLLRLLAEEMDPLSPLSDAFELTRVSRFDLGAGISLGMGWEIKQKADNTVYYQSGEAAQAAFVAFDYEKKRGVVVLCGTPGAGSAEGIGWAVMDFLETL
ncbi:MAG: serine hydrolase domain-containing protein [Bacteroidia bacterium]